MRSGKRKKKRSKQLRLGQRDRRVLDHLAVYQHSWLEVLHVAAFVGLQAGAVESTLRRLTGSKPPLVRTQPLYGRRVYYQLTYAGARALDLSHRVAESLGRTTIVRQFAMQSFLFLGKGEQRHLLSKPQLTTVFDVVGQRLPRAHFYLASTDEADKRFGFVMVDFGSDPRRCANRVVNRALRLIAAPKVRSLAVAGLFEISLLTMMASKRRALYQRLKVSKRSGGMMSLRTDAGFVKVRLRIHVVPGLLELIPDTQV